MRHIYRVLACLALVFVLQLAPTAPAKAQYVACNNEQTICWLYDTPQGVDIVYYDGVDYDRPIIFLADPNYVYYYYWPGWCSVWTCATVRHRILIYEPVYVSRTNVIFIGYNRVVVPRYWGWERWHSYRFENRLYVPYHGTWDGRRINAHTYDSWQYRSKGWVAPAQPQYRNFQPQHSGVVPNNVAPPPKPKGGPVGPQHGAIPLTNTQPPKGGQGGPPQGVQTYKGPSGPPQGGARVLTPQGQQRTIVQPTQKGPVQPQGKVQQTPPPRPAPAPAKHAPAKTKKCEGKNCY